MSCYQNSLCRHLFYWVTLIYSAGLTSTPLQADELLEDTFDQTGYTLPPTLGDQSKNRGATPPTSSTLNLQQVYQQAADHNAQWQAQQAKSQAEQQAQQLALSQLLPQITADIQHSQIQYSGNSIDLSPDNERIDTCLADLGSTNINDLSLNQLTSKFDCLFTANNSNRKFTSTSYNLRFNQALIRLPKWYDFQRGRMLRRKAILDLQKAQQALILQAATLYLNSAKSTQLLKQQQQQQQTLQQIFNAKQQAYQNGLTTSGDLIENQAQLDLIKTTVLQAQLQVENAQDDLQAFMQKPMTNLAAQAEQLPLEKPNPDDLHHWLENAMHDNIDLKSAQAAAEATRFHYLAEKMRHAPSLDLAGQYSQIDSGAATAVLDEGKTTNSSIGLSLSMPLYTGGFLSANRAQAKFQNKEAAWTVTQLQQSLQTQIRKQARTLEILILQVQQQRNAMASNQQALSAITQGYRNGVRNSADVFKAQMDVLSLKRSHTESQYDYLLASLQLKQLLGVLSERDLATVDVWLR